MTSSRTIHLICSAAIIAAIVASSWFATAITAQAGRAQLVYADRPEEGDPPEVAVGIALGAFRGLFVNILWLRANKLKEEGKFYESIELARTITRLQPRFPRVWIFQAWNMAYNISVATNRAEDRWMWVKAGIDLLRRHAIPANPSEPVIQRELAWIYNHKIQGITDDANQYYKRRIAEEWTIALGKPPPRPADTEEAKRIFAEWIRLYEAAPDTIEEAIAKEPALATLIDRIDKETKVPLDFKLLRTLELYTALSESWAAHAGLVDLSPENRNDALLALMAEQEFRPAWELLIRHLRKRYVTDEANLELPRMIRYTEKYGPLDWRHPSTHALYWSLRASETGRARLSDAEFDLINTDRIALHAVQELARWGDLYYDLLDDSTYIALPSADFIPLYGQLLEEFQRRGSFFEDQARVFTTFALGYENFLRDAIRFFFRSGDLVKAQHYFDTLRNWPGLNLNATPDLLADFSLPIDEFVKKDLQDRISSPQVAIQELDGAITSAYLRGALRGNRTVFDAQMNYARFVHRTYMEDQLRQTPSGGERERTEFFPRDFNDAVAQSLTGLLLFGRLGLQDQATLYRRAPDAIQKAVYDQLVDALTKTGGLTLAQFRQWFPEPPDMEQYRKLRDLQRQTDNRSRKDQLQVAPN
ncbi:MAG: hypothetical protein AB7G17_12500 [Phycisphaerales bacterium]